MRIPLTPLGIPEMFVLTCLFGGALGVALAFVPAPWCWVFVVPAAVGLAFVFNFFRDPDRTPEGDDSWVVAPADGKVTDILEVAQAPFLDGPALRVGIFLSVFDVHVNRSPLAGRVAYREHRPGAYLDARDPAAADQNEACDLGLEVSDGDGATFRVLVRQVSGLVARRILCPVEIGQRLERGQRYGMIKFGSRTEVWLPADRVDAVSVRLGQRVKGGRDALLKVKTVAAMSAPAGDAR